MKEKIAYHIYCETSRMLPNTYFLTAKLSVGGFVFQSTKCYKSKKLATKDLLKFKNAIETTVILTAPIQEEL